MLPASVCAKADKYSFSDFLPRVISYFTVQGTQYAMPFNTSGPVLYYNKKAFTAAGLDPDKPPTTLDEVRAAAEKLKANGVPAPLGLKTEPGFLEHWRAMANQPLREQQQRSQGPRHQDGVRLRRPVGRSSRWMAGMVKDGLATTNADVGTGAVRQPARDPERTHAMTIDTSAALGTITSVLGRRQRPQRRARRRADAGPGHRRGQGRRVRAAVASCSW